jgi:superfamily II DNA helicase RecQ
LKTLAKLYGPGASFRSPSQELAFYHALARDVDLMLIFPTGHGKSLLFQLPLFIEAEYTTVLFVPLQLLKFQFGEAAQYPIATWRSNHTPLNRPHLLVASYEDAVDIKLHNYLIQLHSESRLSRLVFNTLASMRSYRDNVIRCLFTLRTQKTLVPLIFLSATMSHERETEVKGSFRCPNAKTIRLPSNRPNIKYSVFPVSNATFIPKQPRLF